MTPTTRQPLILVADDVPEYREDTADRLRREFSARVITADTVMGAVEVAKEHKDALDIIILDMHMPLDKNKAQVLIDGGIQFLRRFGADTVPVIVFTAYWSFQDCVVAVLAGAAAYIPKQSVLRGDGEEEGGINDLVATCGQLLPK